MMRAYTTSGYAVGSIGGCGGAEMLLTDFGRGKRHGGTWRAVLFTQEAITCSFAKKYTMPSAIVGTTCYSQDGTEGHPYHQMWAATPTARSRHRPSRSYASPQPVGMIGRRTVCQDPTS